MRKQDRYYVLCGNETIECNSLLEIAGKLGGLFDKGRDLATVMILRKDNK